MALGLLKALPATLDPSRPCPKRRNGLIYMAYAGVAQLIERLLAMQKARGLSPLTRTTLDFKDTSVSFYISRPLKIELISWV